MANGEQVKDRHPVTRTISLWAAWTLATGLGTAAAAIIGLWYLAFTPSTEEMALIWVLVGPLLSAPLIGLCQLPVLRRRIPSGGRWWLLTGLAWIPTLAILLFTLSSLLYGGDRRFPFPPAAIAATAGVLIGFLFGGLQWTLLRKTVLGAGWWILTSMAAWTAGLLLIQSLGRLPLPMESYQRNLVIVVVGMLLVSMVTGIGFAWLFEPSARALRPVAILSAIPLVLAFVVVVPLTLSYSQQSRVLRPFNGLANVLDLAFSPDGSMLAVVTNRASQDGESRSVVVWDMRTGEQAGVLDAYADHVLFHPKRSQLVTAKEGHRQVIVWDIAGSQQLFLVPEKANAIAVSSDGKLLAIASGDYQGGEMVLCDLATGGVRDRMKAGMAFYIAAFSPDNRYLATGMGRLGSGYLRIWDLNERSAFLSIPELPGGVTGIAFTSDGKRLVFSSGLSIRIWNLETRQQARLIDAQHTIEALALSPDNRLLAIAYGQLERDRAIYLYNMSDGSSAGMLSGHTRTVTSLAFSPDGKYLASGSWDGTVRLWEMK